jgi:hypothetical protein
MKRGLIVAVMLCAVRMIADSRQPFGGKPKG